MNRFPTPGCAPGPERPARRADEPPRTNDRQGGPPHHLYSATSSTLNSNGISFGPAWNSIA